MREPIEYVSVHCGPDRFHQIASQTISGAAVNVQETESGIEPKRC